MSDARKMFDEARTSREIFGCPDQTCCGNIERMLKNPEAHLMIQKGRQVKDLSITPESQRAERFLTEYVEQARRRSDRAMNLKKTDGETKKKIAKAQTRLIRFEKHFSKFTRAIGTNGICRRSKHSSKSPQQGAIRGERTII